MGIAGSAGGRSTRPRSACVAGRLIVIAPPLGQDHGMLDAPLRVLPGAAERPTRSGRTAHVTVPVMLVAGAVAAGCAAVFAARLVGPPTVPVLPGLPDAGALTRLALPLARTAYDIAAVGVFGTLVLGVVLLPRGRPDLVSSIDAAMRAASRWALGWAASAVVLMLLTLSEVLARPLRRVLSWEILGQFAYSLDVTRALMSSAVLALLTAAAARRQRTPVTRAVVLLLAPERWCPRCSPGTPATTDTTSSW